MPPHPHATPAPAHTRRRRTSLLFAALALSVAASSCAGLSSGGNVATTNTAASSSAKANAAPGRTATSAGPVRADTPQPASADGVAAPPQGAPTPARMKVPDAVSGAEILALDGRRFRLSE